MHFSYRRNRGFSLVEVIVSASILLIAVTGFVTAFNAFGTLSRHTADKTQAALLLEEGAEAVQFLRDNGWSEHIAALSLGVPYSLYWDGATYRATTTDMVVSDRYLRQITLSEVERDASDTVASSGTVDEHTRRVTIAIRRAADNELLVSSDVLIHNVYELE